MNCWEHKSCGREIGGSSVAELGVCPASQHDAGDGCWLVAGTFCGGEVQGAFADKMISCMLCDFYNSFTYKEHLDAEKKYQHLKK